MQCQQYRSKTQFREKGVSEDFVKLRYEHALNKVMENINRVLEERKRVSKKTKIYCIENRMSIKKKINRQNLLIQQYATISPPFSPVSKKGLRKDNFNKFYNTHNLNALSPHSNHLKDSDYYNSLTLDNRQKVNQVSIFDSKIVVEDQWNYS